MHEQGKGMRLLYAVFLLAVTARTVIALYDRFHKKDDQKQIEK